ncbi:hypothetical protein ACI2K4_30095 [Micromonospora sp. NPDC050397]|uniref:hypothetical protein n=1 Tax=Micromonospora sp. NPDC050397 TaxID=3364279 RepID=UPI00384CBE93
MDTEDDHVWRTRSRHRTSAGTVTYQSCHCGLWRLLTVVEPEVSGPPRSSVLVGSRVCRTALAG